MDYTSAYIVNIIISHDLNENHTVDKLKERQEMGFLKSACGEVILLSEEPPALGYEQRKKCFDNVNLSCILRATERKLVCVTSGNSYLGAYLVKALLAHGYLVRVTIQNQVCFEDMMELIGEEEMEKLESVVVVRIGDLGSLCDAFKGCHAIFHTSSFIDPHGVSGYTERMAFLESEGASNVIEACGRAAYVKRCIFTSSILSAIWTTDQRDSSRVDESCWSNEEFCRQNKFWLALGKTRAEKVAWRKSKELKVRLVTVCPGLLMDPTFPNAHTETSIPYLKGGRAMLQQGILAIEDASKVAEAHVRVYQDLDYGACGRYLCFGRIVRTRDEAIQLENELKMHDGQLSGGNNIVQFNTDVKLSNSKLTKLLFRASQRLSSCKQQCDRIG